MTTGEKIQKLRKDKKITQEQLADSLNVSRQSVYKWETDTAFPETDKLIKLSEMFGVSVDFLLKESCESTDDRHHRNRAQTFLMGTMLIVVGIVFSFCLSVFLIYATHRQWIGFVVFLALGFAATIAYVLIRNSFLLLSDYSDADKLVIFKQTKLFYYMLIIATCVFAPLFLTFTVFVLIPGNVIVTTYGFLSFGSLAFFAPLSASAGWAISACVQTLHEFAVYPTRQRLPIWQRFFTASLVLYYVVFGFYCSPGDFSSAVEDFIRSRFIFAIVAITVCLLIYPVILLIKKKLSLWQFCLSALFACLAVVSFLWASQQQPYSRDIGESGVLMVGWFGASLAVLIPGILIALKRRSPQLLSFYKNPFSLFFIIVVAYSYNAILLGVANMVLIAFDTVLGDYVVPSFEK